MTDEQFDEILTKVEQTRENQLEWDRLVAEIEARRAEARRLADLGKPMRFASPRRPDVTYVVTPDMDADSRPGSWRVTTFDKDGPWGHFGAFTAYDAFMEVLGMVQVDRRLAESGH